MDHDLPEQAKPDLDALEGHLQSAVRIFDLPFGAAKGYVFGEQYDLNHGPLVFGKRYRVTQGIASNRGDALVSGDDVRFVGADHRNGTELILHFEMRRGVKSVLHFDQNAPQVPDKRRYLRDVTAHFRPALFDFAARRKRLMAAHVVLFNLRNQHEAQA